MLIAIILLGHANPCSYHKYTSDNPDIVLKWKANSEMSQANKNHFLLWAVSQILTFFYMLAQFLLKWPNF